MSNELRPQDQDDNQADLEDDPLAELARIVAGEPEPEPVSQPVAEEESTVEPEPDTLDAVEEHASVTDLKADTLDSIDKQLEQVEKNLESALSDEFEQADLPETPVSVAVEDSTVVEAAEEVTPASSSDDDGFLDGLRTAIDGEIEGQLADAPEEQSFPSDPEGFEDDLISALSLEVEAANQDVVQNDALDDLDAHVEQSLEDELGAGRRRARRDAVSG